MAMLDPRARGSSRTQLATSPSLPRGLKGRVGSARLGSAPLLSLVFIGYPPRIKGYRLYNIMSQSFLISKYVIFHEHISPFHSIPHKSNSIYLFSDFFLPHFASDVPTCFLPNIPPHAVLNEDGNRSSALQSIPPSINNHCFQKIT